MRDAAKNYYSFTILVVLEGGQTRRVETRVNAGEILVKINGEERRVPAGGTVATLLDYLGMEAERVAVELNRQIVRKGEWGTAAVGEGAEVEIVMFVGGG